jgi:hypothetical protein
MLRIIVIGENVRLAAGLDWLGALSGRLLIPIRWDATV